MKYMGSRFLVHNLWSFSGHQVEAKVKKNHSLQIPTSEAAHTTYQIEILINDPELLDGYWATQNPTDDRRGKSRDLRIDQRTTTLAFYEWMLLVTTDQPIQMTNYTHSCSIQALQPCYKEPSETDDVY